MPAREGYYGFQVRREPCAHCLFGPGRIVSKTRMQAILRDCRDNDKHFCCHEYPDGDVCCAGDYTRDPQRTNLMRIAHRLGVVQMVDGPPEPRGDNG